MKIHLRAGKLALLILALMAGILSWSIRPVPTNAKPAGSVNVAMIGSNTMLSGLGGFLPTSGTDLAGITFTNLLPANVTAANLAPYDTVVLNVSSPSMSLNGAGAVCDPNLNQLSTQAKTDLVNFVASGKKMIIYMTECFPFLNNSTLGPDISFSWLPFPFTAKTNWGGSSATLTIVEQNTMASSNPASPYYINAALVSTTDAAVDSYRLGPGYDRRWCTYMTSTNNTTQITGITHAYVRTGNDQGLYIFNGLDADAMPATPGTTGAGYLRKTFVLQLQQSFNPSGLSNCDPTTTTSVTCTPNPSTIGQAVTCTATITENNSATPVGTMAFSENNNPIAGCTSVTVSGNTVQCTTSALTQGSHNIVAAYSGGGSGNGTLDPSTSSAYAQVVNATAAPRDVPEGDTLLLLGGGMSGLGVWLRYQWSKRRAKR